MGISNIVSNIRTFTYDFHYLYLGTCIWHVVKNDYSQTTYFVFIWWLECTKNIYEVFPFILLQCAFLIKWNSLVIKDGFRNQIICPDIDFIKFTTFHKKRNAFLWCSKIFSLLNQGIIVWKSASFLHRIHNITWKLYKLFNNNSIM